MSNNELVDQWFAQTIESYPRLTARFMAAEKDAFRNPVGNTLRAGMAVLVEEILGAMDGDKVAAALDAIVRIRAVQDFKPSEAVRFVFLARSILLGSNPPRPAMIEARIDQLALMAFDHYMSCREQVIQARIDEAKRVIRVRPALHRR